jgi:succinate dehydrogenase / fumarate reductase, cytochrome b subunit
MAATIPSTKLGASAVEAVPGSQGIPDGRYAGYFLVRRLHSLTGVFPVGLFLLEHFFFNSFSLKGPGPYADIVGKLRSLPYLPLIEFFFILAPLYFHGLLGLILVWGGQVNVQRFPFGRNWMYFLQRLTGVTVLLFVTYHLWHMRFGGRTDFFNVMAESLARPGVLAVYVAGVLASSYHLANGLWGFCITWGLTTGRRAQQVGSYAVLGVFAVLSSVSVNALLGFIGKGLSIGE